MVTPKFVSFCYFLADRDNIFSMHAEGVALQMSIIVLFGQIKSGNFRDKRGKISD
jgi:hypothetical protein